MALTAQNKTDYAAILALVTTLRGNLSSVDPEAVSVSKVLRQFQQADDVVGKHNKNKG